MIFVQTSPSFLGRSILDWLRADRRRTHRSGDPRRYHMQALSRREKGKHSPPGAAVVLTDVNALLQRLLELLSVDIERENIRLDLTLDTHTPPIWGEADQIELVLMLMLKNAEQSLVEHGGGRLKIVSRHLANTLHVDVAGEAIFSANDETQTAHLSGWTGGLAVRTCIDIRLCHAIIQHVGGLVRAQSLPDGGTVFHLELPTS
jgi:signal transduction histidine kinase